MVASRGTTVLADDFRTALLRTLSPAISSKRHAKSPAPAGGPATGGDRAGRGRIYQLIGKTCGHICHRPGHGMAFARRPLEEKPHMFDIVRNRAGRPVAGQAARGKLDAA